MTGRAAPALILAAALLPAGCAGADKASAPLRAEPAPESAPKTAAPALSANPAAPAVIPAAPPGPGAAPAPVLEPEEPAFTAFQTTPDWTAADLDGRTAEAVRTLLGPPDFVRADPPAAYWRYGAAGCALDVFLYAETEAAPVVRHTDMRWDAGVKTAGECLNHLRRAHRAPGAPGETG